MTDIYLILAFLAFCILFFSLEFRKIRESMVELSEILKDITEIQRIDGDRLTDLENSK